MKKKEEGCETITMKTKGMVSILFDRFIDMSENDRPPENKMYLTPDNELYLPSENIYSFLFGEKPGGCAMRFEKKKWKEYKMIGMSYVSVQPEFIPFLREDKPIVFHGFKNEYDSIGKIRVMHHKAMIQKGRLIIPSPKIRPMLETPWELIFNVTVFKNPLITVDVIKDWFSKGGTEIGFGTYRPRFGRFIAEF